MRYLTSLELRQFHDALLGKFKKHATSQAKKEWGYPHGVTSCDTYSFSTKHGMLYLGHYDYIEGNRWWIPITLEEQVSGAQLPVTFEMSIPKTRNMRVSVHYAVDDNGLVHILDKGKFTVGYGSVGMQEFFTYYRKTPGQWPLMQFNSYDYVVLGKLSLNVTDSNLLDLLGSLAEFAIYILNFKNKYR